MKLLNEGLHQVGLHGDNEVLHVTLHCGQCPVEGASDEQAVIHHRKLVMHMHRANIIAHADTWRSRQELGGKIAQEWKKDYLIANSYTAVSSSALRFHSDVIQMQREAFALQ